MNKTLVLEEKQIELLIAALGQIKLKDIEKLVAERGETFEAFSQLYYTIRHSGTGEDYQHNTPNSVGEWKDFHDAMMGS